MPESSVLCPTCGLSVPAGVAACPRDGTPLDGEGAWREPTHVRLRPGGYAPTSELPGNASARAGEDRDRPTLQRPLLSLGDPAGGELPQRDPMIGMQLGEYEVEELIGVGGMGLVYRGVQPVIGKPVAIKVLRPEISDSATHVERLLAEARAVNAVRHRGIIDIFSFGRLPDGRQYFVMEYLQGQALDEYILERAAIPPAEAVTYLQEIASALHAAHEAGVVHRDLKPNNIFLVKQSGGRYVKLLDFGLAKQGAATQGVTPQTRTGIVVGTPEYIAPEQARGEPVGPCTDLYALGVVAFQMVTGQLPFQGKTAMDFVIAHLQELPPAAKDLMPDVPETLSDLIGQLMAKPTDDRPPSAEWVRQELKRIARSLPQESTFVGGVPAPGPRPSSPSFSRPPVPSRPGGGKPPSPPGESLTTSMARAFDARTAKRSRAPWIAGGAVLVLGAAGAGYLLSRPAPARANLAAAPAAVAAPASEAVVSPPVITAAPPVAPESSPPARDSTASEASTPATGPVVSLAAARTEGLAKDRIGRTRTRTGAAAPPGEPAVTQEPSITREAVTDPLAQQRFKALERVDWMRKEFDVRPMPGVSISRARVVLSRAEALAREATTDEDLAQVFEQLRTAEEFLLAPER